MARQQGWEEAFKSHAVHNLIGELETELQELAKIDEAKQWSEFQLRAAAALSLVKRTLDNAVPVLFNEKVMSNIQGNLQNVINGVRNFRSQQDQPQHVTNTEAQIDAIVVGASQLPMPSPPITGDVFSATAQRFKQQIDGLLGDLNEHAGEYEKRLETVTLDTGELQTSLDTLSNETEAYRSNLDVQQDLFEKNNISKLDEFTGELADKTSEQIEDIERKQAKAREILGIISEDALTTDYAKSAKNEGRTANRFRWGSILFMLFAAGTLVWLVYDISKDGFSWQASIMRLLIAFVLFAPSAYMATESAQHRKKEGYYKRVALELSVLGPFTQDLESDERKEITKALVKKYFGRFGKEEPVPTDNS